MEQKRFQEAILERDFIHFANGQTILDEVGVELAGIEAVRKEALGITSEMMLERSAEFWAGQLCRLW